MGKTSRSFSIDQDLDELLRQREDLNPSAPVNEFLREYLSSGRGHEAALAVRLEQVEGDLAEARQHVEKLERERERLEAALEERQADLKAMLDHAEEKVRESDTLRRRLAADNEAVQRWAADAGVSPQRFLSRLEARV